ncbi:ATP-binding protein [Streptomyces sp. BH-SS-21]|uniref:ATP-binding protein n=1 Tax=Streptomyces liliiviolaceus TaxID=2823109 RepID=A0A940XZW5_9ACTN|nr:ATP-binding protein [Streptomyces liliiviolaceus]MBQ0852878.1 ATP-binding protein [Streptomyces liliiviolaceus]
MAGAVTIARTGLSASFQFIPRLGLDVVFERSRGSGSGVIAKDDLLWPRRMRTVVRAGLAPLKRPALTEDAEVLVCELVTNALRHGRGDVGVRLLFSTQQLRIEVRDASPDSPVLRNATPADESGRGLFIVQALASEWSISPDGTMTWCSLTF